VNVLQSEIIEFVPTTMVKDNHVQGDNEGKRDRWIEKIQEYELGIKPTKLIKGQGLAKILSESNKLGERPDNRGRKNKISVEQDKNIREKDL